MTALRFAEGVPPEAQTMSLVALLALGANVASVIILLKWRDGDSNVRSVWLCSRNDAIGNVAVIVAGLLVAATASALPDLLVAIMLAGLFLRSSIAIARQAMSELRSERLHLERGESR
jgi:Co/Zn/Cd efflux system component